jgi:hypothetical protein
MKILMRNCIAVPLLFALGLYLSGCALFIDGYTSPVSVSSTPSRASVTIRGVNGQKMGTGQLLTESFKLSKSTPATFDLPKTDIYDVVIAMKGYKEVSFTLEHKHLDLFWVYLGLDVVTTFGVAAIVDWYGHGWDRFDPNKIQINLESVVQQGQVQEYMHCDLMDKTDHIIKQYSFRLEKL